LRFIVGCGDGFHDGGIVGRLDGKADGLSDGSDELTTLLNFGSADV